MTLRQMIPSTQSLFAFEAAARTLNFTDAGRALNVTQPAISKSIAALESYIGCHLFVRSKTGLSLTREGELLNSAIRLSFPALENALKQISRAKHVGPMVQLSLSTAFVTHWLMPQLEELKGAFPDMSLGFSLDIGEMRGPVAPADLGLRHELEVNPNEFSIPFAPEWILAVASPEYIDRHGTLDAPKTGSQHALVKLDQPRISWNHFLEQTGQAIPEGLPELRVPDYSIVLQQALNGKGVALGFASAIGYLVSNGLLRPALPVSWQTGFSYTLTSPEPPIIDSSVDQISNWIKDQSRTQLKQMESLVSISRARAF
ncbi:LysR family transcriptional regulator [Cochlodiniinecator piscidefendens]|uniref:LysR family transcriptional regulator n=1 Tax=Cochlodiniinecator piscidefendens TaxID=2715756 RepID=UPI00140D98DE|nr:LysR family transcriptional regulator [Cochlodiniinecator piscidefendens]